METVRQCMIMVAATVVVLNAQTEVTQPPRRIMTAAEVIAAGGDAQN